MAILVHTNGEFVYANPASRDVFGVPDDDSLNGKNVLDFVHPDEVESVRRRQQEISTAQRTLPPIVETLLKWDGTPFDAEVTAGPVVFNGKPSIQLVIRDVTEELYTRRELLYREAHYHNLFESIDDAVFVCEILDDHTLSSFLDVNQQACDLTGYDREELMALDGPRSLETDAAPIPTELIHLLRTKGAARLEREIVCKDGTTVPADLHVSLTRANNRETVIAVLRDMSEHRETMRRIEASEERFRMLADNAPGVIYLTRIDKELTGAYLNDGVERLTGYTSAEFVRGEITIQELTHPDDLAFVQQYIEKVIQEQRQYNLTYRLRHRNGSWRTVRDIGGVIRDHEGTPYLEGFVLDITEEVRNREALEESRNTYKTIAENLPRGAVFVFDRQKRITFAAGPAIQDTGYSPEHFVGKAIAGSLPAETYKQLQPTYDAALAGKRSSVEFSFGDKYFLLQAAPLFSDKGEVQGGITLSQEITEQRRIREDLRRLAQAVEQTQEVVVITDEAANILYANPAFTEVTGYQRKEVEGKNPRILQSGRHEARFYEELWNTLLAGETWQGQFINKRKDGSIYYEEASISPVRNDAGEVTNYVAVKHDVTRERELEDQLRQSQKMDAVGKLAGGVAHDFNNLLTVITGNVELLLMQIHEKDPLYEDVLEIGNVADRAGALTRQLLAFSRRQTGQPEVFDVAELVGQMEKMIRRTISEEIQLETLFEEDLPPVEMDPVHLEQVILNLVVNARDAMPSGGNLEIRALALKHVSEERLPETLRRTGEGVLLSVKDDGEGMTPEILEHVFEPFFTTKEAGRGTGLGLASVYGIVKAAGGMIHIESEPGAGTTVLLALPPTEKRATAQDKAAKLVSELRGQESIMVVEDDSTVRRSISQFLNRYGYATTLYSDPQNALEDLLGGVLRPDLLISDIVMPHMSGIELRRRLVSAGIKLPTLFITGYSPDQHEKLDDALFADHYLKKPFRPSELAEKIRSILDRTGEGT